MVKPERRFPIDEEHARLVEKYRMLRSRHLRQPNRRSVTAIHIPTCIYLHRRLDEIRPGSVVDMGSGFSTVALRAWAAERGGGVTLHTTDHAPRWLNATRRDLRAEGLPDDGCYLHDDWEAGAGLDSYDVMFVDLHSSAERVRRFDRYMDRVSGIVVFDDWQFPHLSGPITDLLDERGLVPTPLPNETMDEHDRYVAEVVL